MYFRLPTWDLKFHLELFVLNLFIPSQAKKVYPETGDFGRLPHEAGDFDQMPAGQPTCYSIIEVGSEKILVRFPADGISEDSKISKILPKLEYQIWYGGEVMTNAELVTEWIWSKFFNVSVRRPRVQVQTGQVFVEEIKEVDNWKKIENKLCEVTGGINIMEQVTKKVTYVLQKMGEMAQRHDGGKVSQTTGYSV